jgi:hypothetical protein
LQTVGRNLHAFLEGVRRGVESVFSLRITWFFVVVGLVAFIGFAAGFQVSYLLLPEDRKGQAPQFGALGLVVGLFLGAATAGCYWRRLPGPRRARPRRDP